MEEMYKLMEEVAETVKKTWSTEEALLSVEASGTEMRATARLHGR